jgi:hypothetical protein
MRLLRLPDALYLEHDGRRVPVDDTDLFYLVRMTPLGRKVYYRNKAKEILSARAGDSSAETLLEWYRLPAQDWSFGLPPDFPGAGP